MRHLLLYLLFFSLSGNYAAFGDNLGSLRKDPIAICRRVSKAPIIDGRLDDSCWKGSPAITRFVLSNREGEPERATHVFLAYTEDGLFVAFRCFEPELSKLKTGERYVWRNDSVEVLIDADRDREGYVQMIGDVAGGKFQQLAGIAGETPNRNWNTDWKFAAARGVGEWTAEFFVPAQALGIKMQDGTVIRANFARNEKPVPEASSWTQRSGDICQARYFGNVVLGSKTPPVTADLKIISLRGLSRASARVVLSSIEPVGQFTPFIKVLPRRGIKDQFLSPVSLRKSRSCQMDVNLELPDEHRFGLELWAKSKVKARPEFLRSYLYIRAPSLPPVYGAVLNKLTWGRIWEANATCKVTPNAPVPNETSQSIRIYAAKNEFEPFQLVITPNKDISNLRAKVTDFVGPRVIAGNNISVRLVETVPVTVPTSPDCAPGDYPDPLVPFESVMAKAGRNTVLWFTVRVPPDALPGTYRSTVQITADGVAPVTVPVILRVWAFSLPEITRLRTAYGCDYGAICRWHGASSLEEKRKIAALTNENFIQHRVCPINPLPFWGLDTEIVDGRMVIVWDEYDEGAEQFLPKMNSFNLPGAFMSSVRQKRASEPGYAEEKKEFLRLVASHLKEKGWFEKGYNYIFDEPNPEQYPDIVREAKIWHDADPGFKILLTEQPEPELYGAVDIWTPVLDAYVRPICQERQAKGEEVWWYVCCGPHHPYPNNFIDYPAIDHRILHWMNWKYHVTGVLYWQTTFWRRDPWQEPMNDEGGKNLGNGDGILLYPAVRKPSEKPILQGPLDSIRWEMIREGIEDYDYLAMLDDAIRTAQSLGVQSKLVDTAKSALSEVDRVVRSVIDYEKDPRRLYSARIKVGNALEALLLANASASSR